MDYIEFQGPCKGKTINYYTVDSIQVDIKKTPHTWSPQRQNNIDKVKPPSKKYKILVHPISLVLPMFVPLN